MSDSNLDLELTNPTKPRRCTFTANERIGDGTADHPHRRMEVTHTATFHKFSQAGDHDGQYPVAIVELDDGRIMCPDATKITFII